jgi:hypothetical protein
VASQNAPYIGDALKTTFQTSVDGTPTDPDTITLKYQPGNNQDIVTWVYGGTGSIERDSAGEFEAVIVGEAEGDVLVQWTGTGAAAITKTAWIRIQARPLG